jgi:hypothetical protein
VTIVDLDLAPPPVERPRRVVPSRSVALFVVGLLTLILVTASARPAPPFGGALWSTPYDRDNDTVTLTPTSLYLFHHDAGGPTLKAFDLATGAVQWSAPAPDLVAQVPAEVAGVLVAPDGFERYFNRPDLLLARTTRTVARDAKSGAVLWRAAGAPEDVNDRSVLLLVAAAPGGVDQLRDVSLHDGRTLWTRPAPGFASVAASGDTVVTGATDDTLTALRYGDGSVTRTEKVAWPDNGWLSFAAGDLVVTSQEPGGQATTVYRPDTLAQLWQSDGPLTDCYVVLCGSGPGGLTGYDPRTGAVRWRLPGMTVASPIRPGRIIASSEVNGVFQVLDPASGRPIGAAGTGLGTWRSVDSSAVDGVPAQSSTIVLSGVPESPDETAVARLDIRTGRQDVLGAVQGTAWIGCRSLPKYLVCLQNTRATVTAVG